MDAAEIDRELGELEGKVEHLRALYEQYFMGMDRLEPMPQRRDVERRVGALRREQLRNTAQRFKFNTIVQRLNTMQQHWTRVVREIENGTYRRDVLRAAARFGDGAIAALGKNKKQALELAAAVAKDKAKRKVDEPYELDADDLIEEPEEALEDEAPTPKPAHVAAPPPKPAPPQAPVYVEPPAPAAPSASAGAPLQTPARGLGLGLLPRLSAQPKRPEPDAGAAPKNPFAAARAAAAGQGEARAPAPDAAAAVKPPAFGELDLEIGDAQQPAAPHPAKPFAVRAAPIGGAALPLAPPAAKANAKPIAPLTWSTPAAREGAPAAKAGAPAATVPAATAPAKPQGTPLALENLDLVLPGGSSGPNPAPVEPPAKVGPAPSPQAPSPPIVPRVAAPPAAVTRPAAVSGPKPAEGDLHDQRIRQIYAKYVEARRSTQESTAGITFEKLATSLRAQADKLRSAHPSKSVDYEVVVKDGKTHLKPVLR